MLRSYREFTHNPPYYLMPSNLIRWFIFFRIKSSRASNDANGKRHRAGAKGTRRRQARFGELVTHYQIVAKRVARQMVRDADLARDLAQEAMLRAYLSLDHLKDVQRFDSRLYKFPN
jgi:hypothetical protein